MRRYRWKTYHFDKFDADVIGQHLEGLVKTHELTPHLVVQDARNHDSPIHGCFEWDDSVAAEKHREATAGALMRSLVIVTIRGDEHDDVKEPLFVNVKVHETKQYVRAEKALEDPELREQILERAYRELQSFQQKYERLKELARVISAIKNAMKQRNERAASQIAAESDAA
jgi:hypothetical protein